MNHTNRLKKIKYKWKNQIKVKHEKNIQQSITWPTKVGARATK